MTKRRLKKEVLYGLYAFVFILLLGFIYYNLLSSKSLENVENFTYVSRLFDSDVKSVVSTPKMIVRPYDGNAVKIIKGFYDFKSEESSQENSIINYDNTYMQNSGVIYGNEEVFDVKSVLDGKVTSVKEDKLLGKSVTIEHENGIISMYQGLSEVTVKENDEIAQATIIGKSGTSNLSTESKNVLLFEITVNGVYVNPEITFDKSISELTSN